MRLASLYCAGRWTLSIHRTSVVHFSHRLRPGNNNQLLRLLHVADDIAAGIQTDLLMRQASKVAPWNAGLRDAAAEQAALRERRVALLADLIVTYDNGATLSDVLERWTRESDGAAASMLIDALRGKAKGTTTAKLAVERVGERRNPGLRVGDAPPIGRPRKITPELIADVQAASKAGLRDVDIAKRFGISRTSVKSIRLGSYSATPAYPFWDRREMAGQKGWTSQSDRPTLFCPGGVGTSGTPDRVKAS